MELKDWLNSINFTKENLKEHKKAEFNRLQEEQGERQEVYAELRKDEKKLKANLNKKRSESSRLQAAIKKIIEREIAEAKKRAEKKLKQKAKRALKGLF